MKKIYNYTLFLLIIFNFLLGCQGLKEGLEGNKKSKSGEEFLIEKKSPLVLPPDYSKLPVPQEEDQADNSVSSKNFDLEKILKKGQNQNKEIEKSKSGDVLEKSVLKKIKDN